jgi:WD40 repeat protein
VLTGSYDGTAKVWDATTGSVLLNLQGHGSAVSSASFNRDGTRIVTSSFDGTARVWDARTGAELLNLNVLTLYGHKGQVNSGSFSPDEAESRVVTSGYDGTARVWDAKHGAELLTLKGPKGSLAFATFSPDGTRILTGGLETPVQIWDSRPFRDTQPLEPELALPPRPK